MQSNVMDVLNQLVSEVKPCEEKECIVHTENVEVVEAQQENGTTYPVQTDPVQTYPVQTYPVQTDPVQTDPDYGLVTEDSDSDIMLPTPPKKTNQNKFQEVHYL